METLVAQHWHHLPVGEVVDLLGTDPEKGLDLFEVQHRRDRFGPNQVSAQKGIGAIKRFLLQFKQPLVYILLVAGGITLVLKEGVDAGVIFGVVLVNAIIGFLQESKASEAIKALAKSVVTECSVLRAGRRQRIASIDLVPGDIISLQSGDKVPADMRLLTCRDLQIDESILTGESVPVHKSDGILPHNTVLADRTNMAYSSTLVTYGIGAGVVTATGDRTEVGRISSLIHEAVELATPLTRKITAFSHTLIYIILGLAGLTFLVGVVRGESPASMFMGAVALAVGAIPEGLPAAVTVTLAIGVGRMARRRAIIRKLPAVETLGSTTVICSDKTGTLTENQMTVRELFAGSVHYDVGGAGYAPTGQIAPRGEGVDWASNDAALECLKAGLLCNDSLLVEAEGRWRVQGDPTEGALIVAACKSGLSAETAREELPRIDTIPFESHHQYMATLHAGGPEGTRRVYLKGAVERILERCSTCLDAAGVFDSIDLDLIHRMVDEMTSQGLRVLAMARIDLAPDTAHLGHGDLQSGLVFLGVQGMIDPPRAEAIAAVRKCRTAGIRVKMITGDHARTASAIAQQIGLSAGTGDGRSAAVAVTGLEMAQYSDEELVDVAERADVFARVSPEQKLRLVEALQYRGHIVAMTGDGVNDAPALKQANIGVAMGISGTEVTKEAADMILTDDNFASIEAAVEEGRGVFENLRKFILWTLPTNMGEGLVILAAVFAGVALPILPVQILWINMTTAVLLGMMLAFEPKERGLMERPPRDPGAPILTRELVLRILTVSTMLLLGAFGLFEWHQKSGGSLDEARTIAVNVFVLVEIFYLLNCRSLTRSVFQIGLFSNPWLVLGAVGMVSLQMLFVYLPVMNRMFHSAPVSAASWLKVLAVALIAYGVIGFEKWLRSRRRTRPRG